MRSGNIDSASSQGRSQVLFGRLSPPHREIRRHSAQGSFCLPSQSCARSSTKTQMVSNSGGALGVERRRHSDREHTGAWRSDEGQVLRYSRTAPACLRQGTLLSTGGK
ncbi:unnamed protein product [Boreogadus saida]